MQGLERYVHSKALHLAALKMFMDAVVSTPLRDVLPPLQPFIHHAGGHEHSIRRRRHFEDLAHLPAEAFYLTEGRVRLLRTVAREVMIQAGGATEVVDSWRRLGRLLASQAEAEWLLQQLLRT